MGNVSLTMNVVVCALLALAGCNKPPTKKSFIQRGQKDSQGQSEWAKEVQAADNTGCMRLVTLSNLVNNLEAELLSVHVADLDFVTVKRDQRSVRQVRPHSTPGNASNSGSQIVTTKFRNRISFVPAEGELDLTKIAYFFKPDVVPHLARTLPGSELKKVAYFADLISAKEQNGCESAVLVTEQGLQKFEVVDGGRNFITLESGDEIRSYMLMPNDQILIKIVKQVTGINRCGSHQLPENFRVLKAYMLSKSRNKERFQITANLAQLYRYIYNTPELSQAKASRSTVNPSGGLVRLSGATLQYLALRYEGHGDQFTCSRPVPRDN